MQFLEQTWQAVGWNGITAIASLLTALASLILVIKDHNRQIHQQPFPPQMQRLSLKPAPKTRKHKRGKRKQKRRQ